MESDSEDMAKTTRMIKVVIYSIKQWRGKYFYKFSV